MKKFLKIYDDSTSRYVAINADAVKFVQTANNNVLVFDYNTQDEDENNVKVRYNTASADVNKQIKSLVIESFQKLMCKSYSKATIDINLPVSVTQIEID
jgi:hypothetical protein